MKPKNLSGIDIWKLTSRITIKDSTIDGTGVRGVRHQRDVPRRTHQRGALRPRGAGRRTSPSPTTTFRCRLGHRQHRRCQHVLIRATTSTTRRKTPTTTTACSRSARTTCASSATASRRRARTVRTRPSCSGPTSPSHAAGQQHLHGQQPRHRLARQRVQPRRHPRHPGRQQHDRATGNASSRGSSIVIGSGQPRRRRWNNILLKINADRRRRAGPQLRRRRRLRGDLKTDTRATTPATTSRSPPTASAATTPAPDAASDRPRGHTATAGRTAARGSTPAARAPPARPG